MEKLKIFMLPYERFEALDFQAPFQECWHASVYIAAVYLVVVYSSARVVKEKHNTKWLLAVWNAVLAIFSCYGTVAVTWQLFDDVRTLGFDATVCDERFYLGEARKPLAYGMYLFCLSKVLELLDTGFIILRKAPLQMLHTYHHASVLVFTWYNIAFVPSAGFWYAGMNYLVHAIMYTYYCLRVVNIKLPVGVAKSITSLQSLQMVVGFSVNFYSIYRKYTGHTCGNTYMHSASAIALYFSYFVLFLRFANQRYSKPKSKES